MDDEDGMLYLISTILKKAGHKTITASSGEECLEILKREKPDLILLDVMMPGMDGHDTCKRINESKKYGSILKMRTGLGAWRIAQPTGT